MKKTLYLIYIPLILIEWTIDMIGKMWKILHESIETLTLMTENIINESHPKAPGNAESKPGK